MPFDPFWRAERQPAVVVPEKSETGHADYDALPAAIRASYPLRTWMWLSDTQKATLMQSETEPEWSE